MASSNHVFRLKKSLHGQKQVPCAWFAKFKSTFLAADFKQSAYYPFIFSHQTALTVLVVYVDDILITSDDIFKQNSLFEDSLTSAFPYLCPLISFLKLEASHSESGIFVD